MPCLGAQCGIVCLQAGYALEYYSKPFTGATLDELCHLPLGFMGPVDYGPRLHCPSLAESSHTRTKKNYQSESSLPFGVILAPFIFHRLKPRRDQRNTIKAEESPKRSRCLPRFSTILADAPDDMQPAGLVQGSHSGGVSVACRRCARDSGCAE
ncbi:hypothetical protein DFP72DRAFT_501527 [Ephemerocybe angulata]|uniref:Uncharacterized protein n=1 Tax=Ephemerocybe angulata TaxID=980116 RepID=A0A8H6HRS2_9AGAR|nr:hypothetical protein DFP72DRAFT_501527 [Tulosesus angulatus]